MILHRLDGCSPIPLASYLKALGILRLVSEQADPEARAWWEGDRFLLASHLDEPELIEFFLKVLCRCLGAHVEGSTARSGGNYGG